MPSQRKKLALLKSLKILIDCMSSTGLKKKGFGELDAWIKEEKIPKAFSSPGPEKDFVFRCTKNSNKKNV